ncbi:MAG: hypothetical protein GWP05_08235 [Anaerolineaceae bacterium]|nr:hypothetical protein [Anaerolineaceae bacterium]
MASPPETNRTFGPRVLPAASDLAARVSLDYEQKLFRRNYRRPVLISSALSAEAADVKRWLGAGAARLLGADLAARTLNRIATEAAEPLLLHAIIRGGREAVRQQVRNGVTEACIAADCAFIDDSPAERGERAEARPPWLAVSAVGVVERARMMNPRRFEPGDVVLAVGSNRLWPTAVKPAGKILSALKPAAGLPGAMIASGAALVQPAPVLAGHLHSVLARYRVKRVVHAMTTVEGDGLAAALDHLLGGRFEVRRGRARPAFSELMLHLAERGLDDETIDEGHRLGIGYLMVVSGPFANAIARRLRRLGNSVYQFGRLAERQSS